MLTILYILIFSSSSLSEMQYYGNKHYTNKIKQRDSKLILFLLLIDIIIILKLLNNE